MIRFKITEGENVTLSPWADEPIKHGANPPSAVTMMAELRQQHPNAAISIERTTVIPKPENNQVRFKIVLPNNETRWSRVVNEDEAEKLEAELRESYSKAVISRG